VVGTKVSLAHDGNDWSRKCWSARGMSGHESAGPPRDIFYLSSAGTLTCVRSLVTSVESVLPPCLNNSQ
jgi:hypothetical protein